MSLLTLFQNNIVVQSLVPNSRFYAPYVGYASQLPAKDPGETWVLTFDASSVLAAGETLKSIISAQSTCVLGVDANAALVLGSSPAPQINTSALTITTSINIAIGMGVMCEVTGGLTGCKYQITIECATSNPYKTIVLKAVLPVSAT